MIKKIYFEIFALIFLLEIKNAVYKTNDTRSSSSIYVLQRTRLPVINKNIFLLLANNKSTERNNTSRIIPNQKQYVSKINRKQYEIINMLWRKTKIFINVESNTEIYGPKKHDGTRIATVHLFKRRNPFDLPLSSSFIQTTTPSNFEFYYMHEFDDYVKNHKSYNTDHKQILKVKSQIEDNLTLTTIGTFNIHNDVCNNNKSHKITLNKTEHSIVIPNKNNSEYYDPLLINTYKYSVTRDLPIDIVPLKIQGTLNVDSFHKKRCEHDFKSKKKENNMNLTTFYDKIKFFELYDNQTQIPIIEKNIKRLASSRNQEIIHLKHVHNDNANIDNETRYDVKKHIVQKKNIVNNHDIKKSSDNLNSTRTTISFNLQVQSKHYSEKITKHFKERPYIETNKTFHSYVNKSAMWSEYPFTAVYVYKPSQVHCDAAGISPHWLIASGSCLSRQRRNLGGGGQSAFVTYCGNSWWLPERLAYVKYSLVHPRYHPRDRIRRQLYNIGVIQTISSMPLACPSWSPVSLMSHQFTANPGSKATAVGWGLDRYDTRYTSTELPKRPLMSYESLVHSKSCPGNFEYSKGSNFDGDDPPNSIYCLSLPPYNGEDNDPTHGGLLLVENKLVALYLQEERRPWGEQAAQYTGTWRLIPWIFDVAQEYDEIDSFTVDV